MERLRGHLQVLTRYIGERSVTYPENLDKAARYIQSFYEGLGSPVGLEPYRYRDFSVANIIAEIAPQGPSPARYLVGAHYDSVSGTVGADDNASAVAVQLEIARRLKALYDGGTPGPTVKFVSFTLEEPPAFVTRFRGSRVHAKGMKEAGERIDGMICLEMVGYTSDKPGSQNYPFPLKYLNYPKQGNFIGIVGNFKSMGLTGALSKSFRQNKELPVVKLTVPFSGWLLPNVRRSDHISFWDEGYKAVMITDTSFYRNPHYHKASDDMETLNFRFMAELVESLLRFFTG